jgi:hypothetical protein
MAQDAGETPAAIGAAVGKTPLVRVHGNTLVSPALDSVPKWTARGDKAPAIILIMPSKSPPYA